MRPVLSAANATARTTIPAIRTKLSFSKIFSVSYSTRVTTKHLAASELCFPVSENAVRRIFGERDELNAPAVEDYPLHPDPMDGETTSK